MRWSWKWKVDEHTCPQPLKRRFRAKCFVGRAVTGSENVRSEWHLQEAAGAPFLLRSLCGLFVLSPESTKTSQAQDHSNAMVGVKTYLLVWLCWARNCFVGSIWSWAACAALEICVWKFKHHSQNLLSECKGEGAPGH